MVKSQLSCRSFLEAGLNRARNDFDGLGIMGVPRLTCAQGRKRTLHSRADRRRLALVGRVAEGSTLARGFAKTSGIEDQLVIFRNLGGFWRKFRVTHSRGKHRTRAALCRDMDQ